MALHRVLETPKDKIVFDVGHQCYTHKLLTGRRKQFDHLRQLDGISGFPNPHESVHDAFIAGHGNTALSLAIGMLGPKRSSMSGLVVAVIGDGAFTGGMVYEGMNNIGGLDNLLVILNDNKMSISKNVGALARYLTHLRTTTAYYDAKDNVRSFLDGVPLIGTPMKKSLIGAKRWYAALCTTPLCLRIWALNTSARWMATTWRSWNAPCARSTSGRVPIFAYCDQKG